MAIDDPDNWGYYSELNINNPSPDYQMRLVLKRGTGTNDPTKGIIYDGGNCSYDDMRDVRVGTDSDPAAAEQLPQWTESITSGVERILWVKSNGNSTIYLFVGNSNASEYSDGDNTFIFFDDFESLDLDKWDTSDAQSGSIIEIVGGRLHLKGYSGKRAIIKTKNNLGIDYDCIYEMMMEPKAYATSGVYPNLSDGTNIFINIKWISWDANELYLYNGTTLHKFNWNKDNNKRVKIDCFLPSTKKFDVYLDDNLIAQNYDAYSASFTGVLNQIYFKAGASANGGEVYIDNLFIRKYASTEPTWDSFGVWQEISPPPPPPTPSGGLSDINVTPARVITTDFPAAAGLPKDQKIRIYAKAVSGQEKEILLDALT